VKRPGVPSGGRQVGRVPFGGRATRSPSPGVGGLLDLGASEPSNVPAVGTRSLARPRRLMLTSRPHRRHVFVPDGLVPEFVRVGSAGSLIRR
jgi:hypothetical protein